MANLSELYQQGDWKSEKHSPVIEGADMSFKTDKAGTLIASSYCNIHGLWESSKKLSVS